jgi:hypothetical protein
MPLGSFILFVLFNCWHRIIVASPIYGVFYTLDRLCLMHKWLEPLKRKSVSGDLVPSTSGKISG